MSYKEESEGFVMKNRLREVRKKQRISMSKLAAITNVSYTTIFKIECRNHYPSYVVRRLLCLALNKTDKELFYCEPTIRIIGLEGGICYA